jgi:hypothetical protein
MTDVKVNSRICGFTHKISGKVDGKNMIIDIETPCKKVAMLSHMEIPVKEYMNLFTMTIRSSKR